MMNETTDYEKIVKHHFSPLIDEHGDSHLSLNWGSKKSQFLRFKTLLDFEIIKDSSLLDVGSGLGHLYSYIKENDIPVKYTGWDIVPEMVEKARTLHPDISFDEKNITEALSENMFDYVVASGIFTIGCDTKRMNETINAMYKSCRKVCSFNILSSWSPQNEPNEFQADPNEVINYCKNLTNKLLMRHDYLPHDFTIQLYKDGFQ